MKGILAFVFLVICTNLSAQTSWFVGSERYLEHEDSAYYAGFLWRINDSRTFGFHDSIEVVPSGSIDTIFFQAMPDRDWDTIYCFIPEGKSIEFVYNTCCSYFDPFVDDERTYDSIIVHSDYNRALYVGTWEDGRVVPKKTKAFSISQTSKSALTPNIYGLSIRPVSGKETVEENVKTLFSKPWIFFGEPILLHIDKNGVVKVSREH